MYLLTEAIRIENKELQHIDLHNCRINKARKIVFGHTESIDFSKLINIPTNIGNERYKCRVIFHTDKTEYEIHPYVQRKIETLKIVHHNTIEYAFKNTDRSQLDEAFSKRDGCDDIIIVKNGFISDSWAANIILFDGKKWVTPNTPLLRGTQREYLLKTGFIEEQTIKADNLKSFSKIRLINAMIDFDRAPEIDIQTQVIL